MPGDLVMCELGSNHEGPQIRWESLSNACKSLMYLKLDSENVAAKVPVPGKPRSRNVRTSNSRAAVAARNEHLIFKSGGYFLNESKEPESDNHEYGYDGHHYTGAAREIRCIWLGHIL